MKPERLDVTSEELEALLEGVRGPLGEVSYQKLQAAIHTLSYVTELLETREAAKLHNELAGQGLAVAGLFHSTC